MVRAPNTRLFKFFSNNHGLLTRGVSSDVPRDVSALLSPLRDVPLLPQPDESVDLAEVLASLRGEGEEPPSVSKILRDSQDADAAARLV